MDDVVLCGWCGSAVVEEWWWVWSGVCVEVCVGWGWCEVEWGEGVVVV